MDIDAIETELRRRRPEDADALVVAVERWLWWGYLGEEVTRRSRQCVVCSRQDCSRVTFCASPDDQWDPRVGFDVCGACLALLESLAEPPPDDREVLDALTGALAPDVVSGLATRAKVARRFTPALVANALCFPCLQTRPAWSFVRIDYRVCPQCVERTLDDCGFALPRAPLERRLLTRIRR